jgi:hypothetical protein
MHDTALYQYLLGLKSPWTVSRVDLNPRWHSPGTDGTEDSKPCRAWSDGTRSDQETTMRPALAARTVLVTIGVRRTAEGKAGSSAARALAVDVLQRVG